MPALAHRLDKETSGCLVLGRHRKALADLNLLFRNGKVGKTYWAVVEGGPEADEGRIDMPLGRLDDTRGWWMKHDPAGLPSPTTWKVMGRADGLTWLALEPLTGRTHQLRVHCSEMGFPILGDNIYGNAPRHAPGMHLHAREIVVPLYRNKPPIKVVAPVPPHMKERLKACGWDEELDKQLVTPPAPSRPRAERREAASVDRLLHPLRREAVVLVAAQLAAADLGEDFSGGRQAGALDLHRRVPELGSHDRLGALEEHLLDRDHEHAARRLALHGEARAQLRIGRDRGAAHDAHRLADAGNEEDQRDARIGRRDCAGCRCGCCRGGRAG